MIYIYYNYMYILMGAEGNYIIIYNGFNDGDTVFNVI